MNASTPRDMLMSDPDNDEKHWQDKKRYLWLLSPGVPFIGIAALGAYAKFPRVLKPLTWIGPAFIHAIIPFFDHLIGDDKSNPPLEAVKQLEHDPYYDRIVRAFLPLQYAVTFMGAHLASKKETPLFDYLGLAISTGVVNGIAINTGHELSHKHTKFEQLMSHMALAPTAYGHFRVEHPYGHHKRVATPEDPASAKMGETFWEFWPRSVFGGIKSAIGIETRRLSRLGKGFWSVDNELLQGWSMSAALYATLVALYGRKVIPFVAIQAVYGFSLLEVINYMEHYGLKRALLPNGQYARTMPEHSWNNNNIVTNLFLYQLQRHSDHHAWPSRPFQALRHFDDAPQLPSGYASMLLPAYFPKWWSKIMDQRVYDHYEGDLNKANIYPKRRAALMAKFGVVDQSLGSVSLTEQD